MMIKGSGTNPPRVFDHLIVVYSGVGGHVPGGSGKQNRTVFKCAKNTCVAVTLYR